MNYLDLTDHRIPVAGDLYDELPLWSAPYGRMLLEQVPLRHGTTILDVGAGTGWLTLELAQRCGPNSTVIAVDPWEAAMHRLARKVDHLGMRNVRMFMQDAASLDLPEASVDLIVSNLGINNLDNREAVLQTCFRAAKPDADVFLTTNLVGHMREFYAAYRDVLLALGLLERLDDLDLHINRRATVDSAKTMLESAGFQFVRAITHDFRERYVDGSALLRHYFVRLGFLEGWKAIVSPEAVQQVFAALEERLNSIASEQGELSLTIPAACIHARKPAEC